jgi:hypothetical protein
MSAKRITLAAIGLSGLLVGLLSAPTYAQEWRRGQYEYFKEAHRFGPHCEYRIRARGSAHVNLFGGGHQVRKAEIRSVQDWEFEAARLFGPRYSGWALAMVNFARRAGHGFVCGICILPGSRPSSLGRADSSVRPRCQSLPQYQRQ